MQKVIFPMGIRDFSYNFRGIYSKTSVSELKSVEKSSKLGRVNKRQARSSWFYASEQARRSLRKSNKPSKSSGQGKRSELRERVSLAQSLIQGDFENHSGTLQLDQTFKLIRLLARIKRYTV